jgi:methyl-accepting chemotaxis protein
MTAFRKLSVSGKILLGYGGTLLVLVVLAVAVYRGLDRTIESNAWVRHTQDVLLHNSMITSELVDMETGMRGFVITGDNTFLDPYNLGRTAVGPMIAETLALVVDNPVQVQRMQAISAAIQDWQRLSLEPTIRA